MCFTKKKDFRIVKTYIKEYKRHNTYIISQMKWVQQYHEIQLSNASLSRLKLYKISTNTGEFFPTLPTISNNFALFCLCYTFFRSYI